MDYYGLISLLFRGFTTFFDTLFYPFYYVWYQPWKELKKRRMRRSTITYVSENEILLKPVVSSLIKEVRKKQAVVENVYHLFENASTRYREKDCCGTRRFLKEVIEKDEKKATSKKILMADSFHWYSYSSVQKRIDDVSVGLISGTCLNSNDNVLLYADTCIEWFLSVMACFRINCPVATVYTNLGRSGVGHCIDLVKPKVIITNQQLLPGLLDILEQKSNYVKDIVYISNQLQQIDVDNLIDKPWTVQNFESIESLGNDSNVSCDVSKWGNAHKDDVAMIMFTSGTTGNPKGVLLTHQNIIEGTYTLQAHFIDTVGYMDCSDETYVAYLPLAHILELLAEITSFSLGFRVAYSSPLTLTDKSPKIASGQKGDVSLINPTFMVAVPLVLNRVFKNMRSAIENKGPLFAYLFKLCFEYKCYWQKHGMDTPLLNVLLFRKMSRVLGGRLNMIFVGGAPLSEDIHQFFKVVICPKTLLGYALTESCMGGAISKESDEIGELSLQDGIVFKLESWAEGGYQVDDENYPGGEILISSKTLAKGYYKIQDKITESSLFTDTNGVKWLRTGDIGRLNPKNGALRIVDRRKDLVKLQMGEYVSLVKIENEIKTHPAVEMVCVYADPAKTATVALVIPNEDELFELMNQLKLWNSGDTRKDFYQNQALIECLLKDICHHVSGKLENFEIPKRITLVSDTWNPDSGLVSSTMKLKRKAIQMAYQDDINIMYKKIEKSRSTRIV